ncbi:MAG: hypothetical protein KGQ48_04010, partial [Bradyrhizobium sp.]|nr:hypothetical protein [Bradyrhizobium sp.]
EFALSERKEPVRSGTPLVPLAGSNGQHRLPDRYVTEASILFRFCPSNAIPAGWPAGIAEK